PAVRNLIREAKTYQIPSVMQTGKKYGMQALDDALFEMLQKRRISAEDAYTNCIEKQKFVKFLKRPPADFTEV
ncbi:MAG: type IV pili twitching motility protein PilT, partial [Desulfobulbaceae bacterium]|nr:type IV pili twitching motility protein PilT [Desulfobulbaceae bacterium]